jgi:hypothetical protein
MMTILGRNGPSGHLGGGGMGGGYGGPSMQLSMQGSMLQTQVRRGWNWLVGCSVQTAGALDTLASHD